MASPPKPWEKPGVNRQSDEGLPSTFMSSGPVTSGLGSGMSAGGGASVGGGDIPPPVPSRTQSGYGSTGYGGYGGGYGGYSSPYSSYGGGMYGGGGMYNSPYSSYGGYGSGMYGSGGGYGMGYNRFGSQNEYNSFARIAEENSRPAFESIESVVGGFSSISMMLDSTYQALYNSFRAVVGVMDNFSRMKMHFAQVFSAFFVFSKLRYLYRKLLVLLRLRPQGFAEEAWVEAGDKVVENAAATGSPPGGKKSSWPVLIFFLIVMGGPWLIWKFLQSAFSSRSVAGWADGTDDHFVARAMYDFQGDGKEELSFKSGSNINVAPKELQPRMKGWLLASVDGKNVGILPANYVKVLGKRRGTNATNNRLQNPAQISSEPNGSFPNDSFSQTGPPPPSANSVNFGQSSSQGLFQTPSALNLENEIQSDFNSDFPNQDMNTFPAFQDKRSPD